MTTEEAIEYFTKDFPNYIFETPSEKQLAYNTAIEALKEIQEYRSLGTIEELKELKRKSEWIHRDVSTNTYDKKLFERIEEALGFKLFVWQKTYIEAGIYRSYGKTVAECLKQLLNVNTPIDYSMRPTSMREDCHRWTMLEIKTKLKKAGIETAPIFFNKKDKKEYSMKSGYEESKWQQLPENLAFQIGIIPKNRYIVEKKILGIIEKS